MILAKVVITLYTVKPKSEENVKTKNRTSYDVESLSSFNSELQIKVTEYSIKLDGIALYIQDVQKIY